jgi:hypothetical protein
MVNGYWEIADWEPGQGVNEFRITDFGGERWTQLC